MQRGMHHPAKKEVKAWLDKLETAIRRSQSAQITSAALGTGSTRKPSSISHEQAVNYVQQDGRFGTKHNGNDYVFTLFTDKDSRQSPRTTRVRKGAVKQKHSEGIQGKLNTSWKALVLSLVYLLPFFALVHYFGACFFRTNVLWLNIGFAVAFYLDKLASAAKCCCGGCCCGKVIRLPEIFFFSTSVAGVGGLYSVLSLVAHTGLIPICLKHKGIKYGAVKWKRHLCLYFINIVFFFLIIAELWKGRFPSVYAHLKEMIWMAWMIRMGAPIPDWFREALVTAFAWYEEHC